MGNSVGGESTLSSAIFAGKHRKAKSELNTHLAATHSPKRNWHEQDQAPYSAI